MKAIILAAGMGKRLGANIPKALVKIRDNETIIDFQINILKHIVNLEDIIVVVGFKGDLITQKYEKLTFKYNNIYANTNTAKSLLIGLQQVDEDVLWLNGDIVFDAHILDLMMPYNDNLICVNKCAVSDEEVKYTIDSEGNIDKISKSIEHALGEATGINFIKKEDIPRFKYYLELCDDQDYFEKGIEIAIENGIKFLPIDIQDNFCVEVDFKEDLDKARKYLHSQES